jgi:ParB-like nuclease domain
MARGAKDGRRGVGGGRQRRPELERGIDVGEGRRPADVRPPQPRGRGRPRSPKALDDAAGLPWGAPRLRVIPLAAVVGTLEPTISFDASFRPASELVRARWERIALAHRRGVALPPISVLQRSDGYYVVDGRHRVSVARALGHRDIEAWVTRVREQARAAA